MLCQMGNWIYHEISKLKKSSVFSGAQSTRKTKNSKACLLSAVKQHNYSAVMSLLDQGCDLEARDSNGYTALHHACRKGYHRIAKLLLDRGASIHAFHPDSRENALHLACKFQAKGVVSSVSISDIASFTISDVSFLLERGADIDAEQILGNTALHFSAFVGDTNASKLLLSYGADINRENHIGQSPLICALVLSLRGSVAFFTSQLVKMRDKNLFLSERNLRVLSENSKVINFRASCEDEIQRMKKSVIGDSNVTIYDIFTEGEDRLADIASNETVERAMESKDYETDFPNYANEIHERFLLGRVRRDLLRRSNEWLWTVINESYELPFFLVERINRCLTTNDLALLLRQKDSPQLEAERREREALFLYS